MPSMQMDYPPIQRRPMTMSVPVTTSTIHSPSNSYLRCIIYHRLTQVLSTPVTYVSQPTAIQTASTEVSQALIPSDQESQASFYQFPQVPVTQVPIVPGVPPGTVLYQMQPPPSPLPSQVVYQVPATPQANLQPVMYQMPNVQVAQIEEIPSLQSTKQEYQHGVSFLFVCLLLSILILKNNKIRGFQSKVFGQCSPF